MLSEPSDEERRQALQGQVTTAIDRTERHWLLKVSGFCYRAGMRWCPQGWIERNIGVIPTWVRRTHVASPFRPIGGACVQEALSTSQASDDGWSIVQLRKRDRRVSPIEWDERKVVYGEGCFKYGEHGHYQRECPNEWKCRRCSSLAMLSATALRKRQLRGLPTPVHLVAVPQRYRLDMRPRAPARQLRGLLLPALLVAVPQRDCLSKRQGAQGRQLRVFSQGFGGVRAAEKGDGKWFNRSATRCRTLYGTSQEERWSKERYGRCAEDGGGTRVGMTKVQGMPCFLVWKELLLQKGAYLWVPLPYSLGHGVRCQ